MIDFKQKQDLDAIIQWLKDYGVRINVMMQPTITYYSITISDTEYSFESIEDLIKKAWLLVEVYCD